MTAAASSSVTMTPTVDPTPCLDIAGLAVAYAGRPALRDVTLPIHTGRITAIVGPSGCGKSTFLASLNRMTDLVPGCTRHGRIRFHGLDVHDPATDPVALRTRIGMIFQRPNPFPLSIRRNLIFPLEHHRIGDRRQRERLAEAALRRVGLWDEVRDRLDAPALQLSGGQQQRLCLARALVLEPEVLLMDEPCSALDPIAGGVVEDLVVSLRGQYTVVIVTHNLAQARRIADDLAVFWVRDGAGTLIEHGPAAATFETPAHDLTAAYVRGIRG
jgi:phosphate transport system ATP-binding protein